VNQVLSPSVVARWVETILNRTPSPALLEAAVQMAQQTGDGARDLPPATLALVRRACEASPNSASLLHTLSGDTAAGTTASHVYGEQLPEGLVLALSE
jgi:uncharacterized protein DUF3731